MSRDYCVGWSQWFDCDPKKIENLKTILKTFGKSFRNFKPTFVDVRWTNRKQVTVKNFDEIYSELEGICTEGNDSEKTAKFSTYTSLSIDAGKNRRFYIEVRSFEKNRRHFSISSSRVSESFHNFNDFKAAIKKMDILTKKFKAIQLNTTYCRDKRAALNSFEDICAELEKIKSENNEGIISASVYGKTKVLVNEKEGEIFHALKISLKPITYKTKESLHVKIEIVNPAFFNDPASAKQNCAEFNKSYKKFREEIHLATNFFDVDSDWNTVKFVPTTKEGCFDLKQIDKADFGKIKEIIENRQWKREEFGEWEKL